jgi:hypothetical protein
LRFSIQLRSVTATGRWRERGRMGRAIRASYFPVKNGPVKSL